MVPFLPIAWLTLSGYRAEVAGVEAEIEASNRHIAQLGAGYLDTLLRDARRRAELTSPGDALPEALPALRWEHLDAGGIVRRSQLDPARVGRRSEYADRLAASVEPGSGLTPVGQWLAQGPPTVLLARRLADEGTLVGALDPAALHQTMHAWSGESLDRHLYAIDSHGQLLFYSDLEVSRRGVDLRTNPPILRFLEGRAGAVRYRSTTSGKERLGFVEKLGEAPWAVIVSADHGGRLLALRSRYLGLAVTIVFAFATAVATLLWAGRRLGAPVLDIVGALKAPDRPHHAPLNVSHATRRIAEYTSLVEAFDELAAEVQAVEKELVHAEKTALLGQLASGLAHEMGTPLNVITGNAQYLLRKVGRDDPARESLAMIVTQADRIAAMIRSLLDLSRPAEVQLAPTDAAAVVQQTLTIVAAMNREGLEMEAIVAPRTPPVLADPKLLEHALLNLVVNATEAMGGHGHLTVRVDRAAPSRGAWVEIRVEDDGPGIPPEHLDKVAQPFFSTKPQGKGTGLGLAIVERIVRQHGGSLRIGNRPEGGGAVAMVLRAVEPWPEQRLGSAR